MSESIGTGGIDQDDIEVAAEAWTGLEAVVFAYKAGLADPGDHDIGY